MALVRSHAKDRDKWQGLYNDVRRWREEDPSLDQLIEERKVAQGRDQLVRGRKKKDANLEHMDWKEKFCRELIRCKGNREKAAAVTPYTPDTIYRMLNENYSEYDKDFSEQVHIYEMRLASVAEEAVWNALDQSMQLDDPRTTAWIGLNILKARDRKRWGDELRVKADVKHEHTWTIKRENMINVLVADQQKFFESKGLCLPSGEKNVIELKQPEYVDAELVND